MKTNNNRSGHQSKRIELSYDSHRFEPPLLEPLFTVIPVPYGNTKVIGALDGGKISRINVGIIRHDIFFGTPKYKLNRSEYERFLECLDRWVEALNAWRRASITPPFSNVKRLTKERDKTETEFMKKYGNVAHLLWRSVRQPNSYKVIPFFNPVYFPRKSRDLPYLWRLVDLVNKLHMNDPVGETRGPVPEWSEQDYLKIANLWLHGKGDLNISHKICGGSFDPDATARIKRARIKMGFRRSRKTK